VVGLLESMTLEYEQFESAYTLALALDRRHSMRSDESCSRCA
jgi:hypothetical protein